jgi:hypothetical protein
MRSGKRTNILGLVKFPAYFQAVANRLGFEPERNAGTRRPDEEADEKGRRRMAYPEDPPPRERDRYPAGWHEEPLGVEEQPQFSVRLGPLNLAAGETALPEPDEFLVETFRGDYPQARVKADWVAVYRPWHIHGTEWGIAISELALSSYAEVVAMDAGASRGQLAPLILRQVLAHEHSHFGFEVAGTQLEDAHNKPLYRSYFHYRYRRPTQWTQGPLEEVVATWQEYVFAKRGANRLPGVPANYPEAVARVNRMAAAGYRDFELMKKPSDARKIRAAIAALLANEKTMPPGPWGGTKHADRRQVRLHWLGSEAGACSVGLIPKGSAPPTITQLRKWLRKLDAELIPGAGKGDHERWRLPDGKPFGFDTGARILLPPETKQLKHMLNLKTTYDVYDHIRDRKVPAALKAATPATSSTA